MRIALIPTGVMEFNGLARSLRAHFEGEHEFVAVPAIPGAPGIPVRPFAGFTSEKVVPEKAEDDTSAVRQLAAELARQVYPRTRRGRTELAADLAIVIDDLELENVGAESAVAGTFRTAVERHVEAAGSATDRTELRRCLRDHGSFHIISVMAESWFFADPQGMARNAVPADRTARMIAGVDPECFETDDADYLADDGSACSGLIAEVKRRGKLAQYKRAPWVSTDDARHPHRTRAKHPKHYLEWRCRDARDKRCTAWREVAVGGEALAKLDWTGVLSNAQHCGFARSFVEDIAIAIGATMPGPPGARFEPLTRFRTPGTTGVLRNL